jgi:cytochrome c-type biogenesis protein CcmE
MKPYVKFGVLIAAILGVLGWLAAGGVKDTKTYYKTISELNRLGDQDRERRMRVGGDVEDNSIVRNGHDVQFVLKQEDCGDVTPCPEPAAGASRNYVRLKVVYNGIEPLPDTFKPGAQALADGRLGPDGVFHASKVQAKCASKYEAKPVQRAPAQKASM